LTATTPPPRPSATYEDLGYRDVFWARRRYEDACDRAALRALLPRSGRRLIEVGAGFGRLAGEYSGYDEVVLLDSSDVHVAAARETLGRDERIQVVLGDAAALPYPDGHFDVVVCVRVLHHFGEPGPIIAELGRVVRPGGLLVLEYANRRNLKSIVRHLLGRQAWSPFGLGAVEYRPFHFDHAPVSIRRSLRAAGLEVERMRAVSLFRLRALSGPRTAAILARLELPLQAPLGYITPGPSVFVAARKGGTNPGHQPISLTPAVETEAPVRAPQRAGLNAREQGAEAATKVSTD
jgi:ubiquinone/menaquinone biosynthesis C-methylase UbiE